MKKLSIILGIVMLMASCKFEVNTDEPKDIKQEPKQEAVTRDADYSKTKFVLFQSDYDAKTTYQKLKGYLEEQGMYYPKVVDHQTAAQNVQLELKPIYLMIFGNPKMGTYLIQENPEVGIELPLKVLIYKGDDNKIWVLYKDMNYLKDLYFLKDTNGVIDKMNKLQAGFKEACFNPIKTSQITDEDIK
jgi:beta-galactosidase